MAGDILKTCQTRTNDKSHNECAVRPAMEGREMRHRRRALGIAALAFLFAAACGRTSPGPAPEPLNILITNDDGIEAPGILALAEALRPLGTVTVAAPRDQKSGASHGVTSDRPISVHESERQGQRWISIDALPATCVRLAVE